MAKTGTSSKLKEKKKALKSDAPVSRRESFGSAWRKQTSAHRTTRHLIRAISSVFDEEGKPAIASSHYLPPLTKTEQECVIYYEDETFEDNEYEGDEGDDALDEDEDEDDQHEVLN